ncbi:MAG: hypothetical protein LUC33_04790, partial [Prevotellaceae bacterium]|nr:hypothetical protein [Prevotellaceae bacterium]
MKTIDEVISGLDGRGVSIMHWRRGLVVDEDLPDTYDAVLRGVRWGGGYIEAFLKLSCLPSLLLKFAEAIFLVETHCLVYDVVEGDKFRIYLHDNGGPRRPKVVQLTLF